MNAVHQLRHAPEFTTPGSHLQRVRIARDTARQLLKLTRDRTNKRDLQQALLDADLHDRMERTVGPAYTGAGTCVLLADTRDRLVQELATTPEQWRTQGAA